ncbi:MAG TPA: aldose epimerase family protein [Bacteriovoracaceae bacterium]|nr:aldose epimerase family protein [Bacteriovoracaceae bacterium]
MEIKSYTLKNDKGMEVKIINYGGIVTSLRVPDKDGKVGDVVLGFDTAEEYRTKKEHPYFGALIGRYGNRIAKGKFTLDGKDYKLATNNGPNSLHGGVQGFDKVIWNATELPKSNALELSYTSKDGEEGYPGELKVKVTYTLTAQNELKIDYEASTSKATPINLTHHSYFNLSADKNETIVDHELMINADKYTVVDKDLTPTGELKDVKGTVMDFTTSHKIGKDIAKVEGGGYDHNYVLRNTDGSMKQAAVLYHPKSGRQMEVLTTEPGIQFYSGNFLDGKLMGKNGDGYVKHDGLCLETQHFPDSPNHPKFPNTILKPGTTYKSQTVYKFSVK